MKTIIVKEASDIVSDVMVVQASIDEALLYGYVADAGAIYLGKRYSVEIKKNTPRGVSVDIDTNDFKYQAAEQIANKLLINDIVKALYESGEFHIVSATPNPDILSVTFMNKNGDIESQLHNIARVSLDSSNMLRRVYDSDNPISVVNYVASVVSNYSKVVAADCDTYKRALKNLKETANVNIGALPCDEYKAYLDNLVYFVRMYLIQLKELKGEE